MRVTINGETRDTEARTLSGLWAAEAARLGIPADADGSGSDGDAASGPGASAGALEPPSRRGFAIALNGEVVRAARWDETGVNEGDRVEIIRAVAGG